MTDVLAVQPDLLPGRRRLAKQYFILEDFEVTEHDKQQTTSDLSQSDRSDQRGILASPLRRRLVKGTTLALPAIMTLRSGSALAATSLTCAAREGGEGSSTVPDGVQVVTTTYAPPAPYKRLEVTVYKDSSDISLTPLPLYYYDTVANVWRNYSDGTLISAEPSNKTALPGPYFALAFVGETGDVVALGPNYPVHSAPVSDTCFASI